MILLKEFNFYEFVAQDQPNKGTFFLSVYVFLLSIVNLPKKPYLKIPIRLRAPELKPQSKK